jgi:hypothetical protein
LLCAGLESGIKLLICQRKHNGHNVFKMFVLRNISNNIYDTKVHINTVYKAAV